MQKEIKSCWFYSLISLTLYFLISYFLFNFNFLVIFSQPAYLLWVYISGGILIIFPAVLVVLTILLNSVFLEILKTRFKKKFKSEKTILLFVVGILTSFVILYALEIITSSISSLTPPITDGWHAEHFVFG